MNVTGSAIAPEVAKHREQRGWCWYDWANSVFPTSVTTVFLSLYLTSVATEAARADVARNGHDACPGGDALQRCDVSLLGVPFPAGSLWGYLLSVATLIQVVVLPVTGAIADRTPNRRALLALFAFGGAASTALLALMAGQEWRLGAALFIAANTCFGASVVVYYSFLPEIADADERDTVSARGWAWGYLGGGVALALHLVIYLGHDTLGISSSTAVRLVFLTAGIWWAAFTLVPLSALPRQHAPEGPEQASAVLPRGFRHLLSTYRHVRLFPLTLAFLGAYWIYTDGISTVTQVSAQYGDLELKLPRDALIVTFMIVQFVAYVGGVVHGLAARRFGAKSTILASLVIWIGVLTAAYFVQAGQAPQFYALAAGIGLVLGGTNALSRSLFSHMVPRGKEAEYFSLYEIGERSTSWLGPLVFAGVGQLTGTFRLAIISLVVFFAVGALLVMFVPVRRAIEAVGNQPPRVL